MEIIKNKTAFITGGTKGIGFGIAEALLKEGVNVAITGRNKTTVDDAVNILNAESEMNAEAMGIQADTRNYEDQKKAVRETVEAFGKVDILIANAGLGHFAPVDELTVAQWNAMIDTNLTGVFYTVKAGMEQLKKNKGYFFSIASLAGTNFFKGGSGYNASKFGVTGFTQAAMLDMRGYGIKTSVIMPGSVATHFNNHTPNAEDHWKIQKEDIGQLVIDLLKMDYRSLPSKVEIRPSFPNKK